MSDFQVVPYDAARRGDYLRLFGSVWGERAMSGEAFDWWFDGNPEGSLRSLAVRDGEAIGAAGHSLFRARLGDADALVQFSLHAVTDPAARGLGIFRAIEARHEDEGRERGSACALVFPNDASRSLYLGPLGFARIDRRRIWARPLAGRRLRRRRRSHAAPVPALERFDAATDRLYARHAPLLRNHLVRDARHLNWRYLGSPRGYKAFGGEAGFAVLGHTERRRLRLALVLDLVADDAAVPALVRACVREAAAGAAALLALPTPCLPPRTLARLGFAPTPARLDLLGKPLAAPLDARSPAWTISLGDTDFF